MAEVAHRFSDVDSKRDSESDSKRNSDTNVNAPRASADDLPLQLILELTVKDREVVAALSQHGEGRTATITHSPR